MECEVAARHLTILECRPRWMAARAADWSRLPVARLRYTKSRQEWTLYWHDSNEVFHRFDPAPPSRHVEALLTVLDRDPTCIFWG
ncbi:Protein of unknown function [Raineyella antarctica]|uniref:DUF3024 domain-containing protein n=1 Tax=Raineyella antarctica TaxID=1577474 RepID=A0A1G6GKS5_9ACTN|nr:Protein of unknown function [Raineyella antarctica]